MLAGAIGGVTVPDEFLHNVLGDVAGDVPDNVHGDTLGGFEGALRDVEEVLGENLGRSLVICGAVAADVRCRAGVFVARILHMGSAWGFNNEVGHVAAAECIEVVDLYPLPRTQRPGAHVQMLAHDCNQLNGQFAEGRREEQKYIILVMLALLEI